MFRLKYKSEQIKWFLCLFFSALLLWKEVTGCVLVAKADSKSERVIVSLGDSYSSGEGIEPFYGWDDENKSKSVFDLDWLAHRSKNAWAGMLILPGVEGTMSDHFGENWYFKAASGAETKHLFEKQHKDAKKGKYKGGGDLPEQLKVFDELEGKEVDYVTLTLGGNDAKFSEIILTAVMGSTYNLHPNALSDQLNYLHPNALSDQLNNIWKEFYKKGGIRDNLCKSYDEIMKKAGSKAHLIVAGYPKLFDENGSILISKEEVTLINIAVSNFNNAIENIVNQYSNSGRNISFVSVEQEFEGHGAYADIPYINEIRLGPILPSEDLNDIGLYSSYSVHPNYEGAKAYKKCVKNEINRLEGLNPVLYSTDFSISTLDYKGALYDNYKIVVEGRKNIALWGLIGEDYYDEIIVDKSSPVSMHLPKGEYTITVTDGDSSYFRKIKTKRNSKNNKLIFDTDFGFTSQIKDVSEEKDKKIDIPSDAVEFNGHYYYLYDSGTASSYEEALQYCQDKGGYLATLTSQEENDFVYAYLGYKNCANAYFGLSDAANEGTWEWCTGEEVFYTNWNSGEPNDENPEEDYGEFYFKYPDGKWNDGDFGNSTAGDTNAFLCEWGDYTVQQTGGSGGQKTTSDERDVVLVLDASGSMAGTPLEETKKASSKFINTVLEQDASIGIVTYDEIANRVSEFSMNQTALQNAVSEVGDGGGTNIEAGLYEARSMLQTSNAKKKIIVLMSDGEPNNGKVGEDLIAYADEIKKEEILIYTIGFFESLTEKSDAQRLMEQLASDGCHYEVAKADDLVFFFEDMADQINGQKYIYVRIACPVDVSVTYNGQTLSSSDRDSNFRTDFGTLTFEEKEVDSSEEAEEDYEETGEIDDRIKVLRLKEGVDYDLKLTGTGRGVMNYTIGFMDEDGNYSDLRKFKNIRVSRRTTIDTVAAVSPESILNIDEDGDGKYDIKMRAEENGYGEEIKTPAWVIYAMCVAGILIVIDIFIIVILRATKKRKVRR